MTMILYITECEHAIVSGIPGVCHHGRGTGTAMFPPNGESHHTKPVTVESWDEARALAGVH